MLCMIRSGNILLNGYDYGFIGGTSGRIGNEIIFCGNIDDHPDSKEIKDFIHTKGLDVKSFPHYPLTDFGSLLCEEIDGISDQ